MLFDTHCHFNDPNLYKDVDLLIENAKKAGVSKFLVVGYNKETSLKAVEISEKYDCCYASIGFHPTEIFDVSEEEYNYVMNLYNHKKVVAIGEIGLDYHWIKDVRDREKQKEWFIKQIQFANKVKKPIIIHCRDAMKETIDILKEHTPAYSGTMHCYGGSVEILADVISLGLYIGLDGPLTFNNAVTPKEVCKNIDINKLLLETDSPYLSPEPKRGQLNKPENLVYIARKVAEIKNMLFEDVSTTTFNNACRLFNVEQ